MNTIETLQSFIRQNGHEIEIDGIFGKKTRGAIEQLCVPNWIKTALKEVGQKEIIGKNHNARVIEYHSTVMGAYTADEIPWCGSFVNWVMLNHYEETVNIPERAKSWMSFGETSIIPVVGSIAVKSRDGGGHVCFVIGKNKAGDLYCVGGNQNNEVNIQLYKKEVFLDFRVPADYHKETLPYYALSHTMDVQEA